MGKLVVLLVAMVATIGGVGSASAPAGGLTPAAGRTYPLHVSFTLTYQVTWSTSVGLEGLAQDGCASWRRDRGVTTVLAQDAPWKRKTDKKRRRHGIPGSLMFSPDGAAPMGWRATGAAIGLVKGTVQRRWLQSGGPTAAELAGPCSSSGSTPWEPVTPTNCGERTFRTKTGSVLSQQRRRMATLDDRMTVAGASARGNTYVLSISLGPARELYPQCKGPVGAPAYPANVGFTLPLADLIGLRDLEPGGTMEGDETKTGACAADLPADATCTFRIDIDWKITRYASGPFP